MNQQRPNEYWDTNTRLSFVNLDSILLIVIRDGEPAGGPETLSASRCTQFKLFGVYL